MDGEDYYFIYSANNKYRMFFRKDPKGDKRVYIKNIKSIMDDIKESKAKPSKETKVKPSKEKKPKEKKVKYSKEKEAKSSKEKKPSKEKKAKSSRGKAYEKINPDDYYFVFRGSRKFFVNKHTLKRIYQKNIDPSVRSLIKENISAGFEERQRQPYSTYQEKNKQSPPKPAKSSFENAKAKDAWDEFVRRYTQSHQQQSRPPFIPQPKPLSILQKLNITTKKEWLQWLRRNHPDHGGSTELAQKVITEGRNIGY